MATSDSYRLYCAIKQRGIYFSWKFKFRSYYIKSSLAIAEQICFGMKWLKNWIIRHLKTYKIIWLGKHYRLLKILHITFWVLFCVQIELKSNLQTHFT
jgi:hypothetical protein